MFDPCVMPYTCVYVSMYIVSCVIIEFIKIQLAVINY